MIYVQKCKLQSLTALQDGGTKLLIKGKLFKVHPAVKGGLHPGGNNNVALWGQRGQHILLVRAQDAGLAFVGEEDVRQPEAFAQMLLAQNIVVAIELLVGQSLVLETQLQKSVHLELQQV